MFRHLARTVRSKYPQYLTQPFDVAELHQNILPYRHHRRELGLDTNEDYEITLMELLSGARDYLIVDERMRDVLRAELASPNPDPSAFKQFANATVSLSPTALRRLEIGPDEDALPTLSTPTIQLDERAIRASISSALPPRTPNTPPASILPPSATPASQPTITLRTIVPRAGERCRACDEVLPTGRSITYCPHCGQNVTTLNCPACGSELEVGWKFCPVCGRPTAGS